MGYNATESNHPAYNDPNAWVPYRYDVSLIAALVMAGLFTLAIGVHSFIMVKRKSWFFLPFVIGGIFEQIGYIARAYSAHKDQWALMPYVVQSLLTLLAPALFAASIYIVLGRIIRFVHGERYSIIPVKYLTKAFVIGDVIAFLTQMAGGGIQAKGTAKTANLGQTIIIVGLIAQIVFFGFFITVAFIFHRRFVRNEPGNAQLNRNIWRRQLWALYVGSILILDRSMFRVAEYVMGNNGFLMRHEIYMYIFDAALMFIVMVIFLVVHPSRLSAAQSMAGHELAPISETELVTPKRSHASSGEV